MVMSPTDWRILKGQCINIAGNIVAQSFPYKGGENTSPDGWEGAITIRTASLAKRLFLKLKEEKIEEW